MRENDGGGDKERAPSIDGSRRDGRDDKGEGGRAESADGDGRDQAARRDDG